TTTTVIPDFWLCAGNWNNELFPAPVPITTNTGLTLAMMARNASSCFPWNWDPLPTRISDSDWVSTVQNRFHLAICASCMSSSTVARFLFNMGCGVSWLDVGLK
ncbi:hypothetical protein DL98DRAFT_440045, partial [Cadophora sp. DSE1049]